MSAVGSCAALCGLQNSMKSIAAGDLVTEIATSGSDEIADMAEALQVFKNNMLESNRLRAERAEAEKHVHAQRRNEMHKLADEFEAAVGEIMQTVSSASTELEASATSSDQNRRGDPAIVRQWWKPHPEKPPRMSGRLLPRPKR